MPRKQQLIPRDDTTSPSAFEEGRPGTPPPTSPPVHLALPVVQTLGGSLRIVTSQGNNTARPDVTTPSGTVRLADTDRDSLLVCDRIGAGGQTNKRRRPFSFSTDPIPSASRPDTSVPAPIPSASRPNTSIPAPVIDIDDEILPEEELNDEEDDSIETGSEICDFDDADMRMDKIDAMEEMDVEIQPDQAREEVELSDRFDWSGDYATFTGRKEVFRAEAGPSTDANEPYDIFTKIWDTDTMEYIVKETNNYAWMSISKKCEFEGGLPPSSRANSWKEVTVAELYTYFGMLILIAHHSLLSDYWTTGIMEMAKFRNIMSYNRFCLISRYLHFCDNDHIWEYGPQRKLAKIKPLIDRMNIQFSRLYTPHQNISIDESLTLWKGRLSWKQCIRIKAARFGTQTYELRESATGYLYRFIVYTGKGRSTDEEGPVHGFVSATSKVVLKLMAGLFDKGYCLVMDNFYNGMALTRYLKSRGTDVIGTLNRRRLNVPKPVKCLRDNDMQRGDRISRHSGDISVVAWKDVKLVAFVSTYHPDTMLEGRRAGEMIMKPAVVSDYNARMGDVDFKDQQLSMYLMERKRGLKWYIKLFTRLLNISILNSLVVHRHNNAERITHRKFREQLALELIRRNCPAGPIVGGEARVIPPLVDRLHNLGHLPYMWDRRADNKRPRKECVLCNIRDKRSDTASYCVKCNVALCIDKCFSEYHTLAILR